MDCNRIKICQRKLYRCEQLYRCISYRLYCYCKCTSITDDKWSSNCVREFYRKYLYNRIRQIKLCMEYCWGYNNCRRNSYQQYGNGNMDCNRFKIGQCKLYRREWLYRSISNNL